MTRTRYYFLYLSKSNGIFLKDSLFRGTCGTVSWQVRSINHLSPLQSLFKFRFAAGWIIFETGGDVECALQPQHPRLLLLRLADPREAQGDKNWCLEDLMAKVMLLLKSSFFIRPITAFWFRAKIEMAGSQRCIIQMGEREAFPFLKRVKVSQSNVLLCNS